MTHAHTDTTASFCGNEGDDCHCHDTKPHEKPEQMVATTHSHHLHHTQTRTERIRPYWRLIITLIAVFIFGIALSIFIGFSWMSVMEYWMGGYFVAFGLTQTLTLKKSAAMFRQYDPLARRVAAYAYALPFIQIAIGLAYFFMVWWLATGLIAFAILFINAYGVDAVRRQNRTVRCACLGETMNVPVGAVTLWENLIMIGMVVMMLSYHALSTLTTGGMDSTTMPGMHM